jgi:hypothetical protein
MNAASKDIATLLQTLALGTLNATSGWAIYYSREPHEKPDVNPITAITVYDTGGRTPDPRNLLDYPTVQIRVRAADFDTGYAKILAIREALMSKAAVTVNGTVYSGFWLNGDINAIGRNDADRPIFTVNFQLMREPASGTHRS